MSWIDKTFQQPASLKFINCLRTMLSSSRFSASRTSCSAEVCKAILALNIINARNHTSFGRINLTKKRVVLFPRNYITAPMFRLMPFNPQGSEGQQKRSGFIQGEPFKRPRLNTCNYVSRLSEQFVGFCWTVWQKLTVCALYTKEVCDLDQLTN